MLWQWKAVFDPSTPKQKNWLFLQTFNIKKLKLSIFTDNPECTTNASRKYDLL